MLGNTKVNIFTDLIPLGHKTKGGTIRPGTPLKPLTITIHNTGNPKSSAKNERAWLTNPSNDRQASYHYVIDEYGVIGVIPEIEVAYHAGDSVGNATSIGIEVCESGDQSKVYANAVGFVALLLRQKNWGIEKVTTHKRWSGKNCPRLLLPVWNEFLQDIDQTLTALKEPPAKPNPEYVFVINERLDNPVEWLKAIEYISQNPIPGHPVTKYIKDFVVKIGGQQK